MLHGRRCGKRMQRLSGSKDEPSLTQLSKRRLTSSGVQTVLDAGYDDQLCADRIVACTEASWSSQVQEEEARCKRPSRCLQESIMKDGKEAETILAYLDRRGKKNLLLTSKAVAQAVACSYGSQSGLVLQMGGAQGTTPTLQALGDCLRRFRSASSLHFKGLRGWTNRHQLEIYSDSPPVPNDEAYEAFLRERRRGRANLRQFCCALQHSLPSMPRMKELVLRECFWCRREPQPSNASFRVLTTGLTKKKMRERLLPQWCPQARAKKEEHRAALMRQTEVQRRAWMQWPEVVAALETQLGLKAASASSFCECALIDNDSDDRCFQIAPSSVRSLDAALFTEIYLEMLHVFADVEDL